VFAFIFCVHRVSEKNKQNYFCYNYVKLPLNVVIFGTKMANCVKLYECTYFPPHLTHFSALLYKTQMFQFVT